MSVVQLPLRPSAEARARRNRIWNPPNGRVSSELEVVSEPVRRQQRIQAIKEAAGAKRDAERRQKIARQIEQGIVIKDDLEAIREAIRKNRQMVIALLFQQEQGDPVIDRPPSMRLILNVVAKFYGVTVTDIASARRTRDVMIPRQVTMYLGRELTLLSLPQIGKHLAGRDHTTILHGIRSIVARKSSDPDLQEQLLELMQLIKAEQAKAAA